MASNGRLIMIVLVGISAGRSAANAATLRGMVLSSSQDRQIAGAGVLILTEAGSQVAELVTDGEGRFQKDGLGRGRYGVVITAAGYLTTAASLEIPEQPAIPEPDHAEYMLGLFRAGVIGGSAWKSNGEPWSTAKVVVMRDKGWDGAAQWELAGQPKEAEDQGEFRIIGLPPGNYRLAAYEPGKGLVPYPTPLRLKPNDIQDRLVVTLSIAEGHSVRGELRPAGPASAVALVDSRMPEIAIAGRFSDPRDGSFEFQDIVPGTYLVLATEARARAFATAAITVVDQDVQGIELVMAEPRQLAVAPRYTTPGDASSCGGNATVQATIAYALNSFPTAGVKWEGLINSLSTIGPFGPWPYNLTLKTSAGNCGNHSPAVIDSSAAQDGERLPITIGRGALVEGHMRGTGCWAVLVPMAGAGAVAGKVLAQQADYRGRYEFAGLDGGDYYLIARRSHTQGDGWNWIEKRDPPLLPLNPGARRKIDLACPGQGG